jgi:2-haloacid dehalogenase
MSGGKTMNDTTSDAITQPRIDRRRLLALAAAAAPLLSAAGSGRIKAVAFDAFTTFDPRPGNVLAERLFPGSGAARISAWRTRQFEYTWLRTLMGRYVDFWQVTQESLAFAIKQLKLEDTPDKRASLLQAFLDMKAWPDALPALRTMKDAGLRLALLANPTAAMLDGWVKNSGLEGVFEPHLTTDRVRAFKPDPRAYQMGVDAFGLTREEVVFAAFGGWDAVGAKAFGYPTFWVNRGGTPPEALGLAPDGVGATLDDLSAFVARRS